MQKCHFEQVWSRWSILYGVAFSFQQPLKLKKFGQIAKNGANFSQLWILLEGKRCSLSTQTLRSMLFKITSDNFYFDLNIVRPKLNKVIFYFFFKWFKCQQSSVIDISRHVATGGINAALVAVFPILKLEFSSGRRPNFKKLHIDDLSLFSTI